MPMSNEAGVTAYFAGSLGRASLVDTLSVFTGIILPTIGKGVIVRRPSMEAAAERLGLDAGAVKIMQNLRRRYGSGPLQLRIPGRPHLLLLDPHDVLEVLKGSPRPFATDTREKRAALDHFEPGNVLISAAARRSERRPLHEQALATGTRVHPLASRFREIVEAEFQVVWGAGVRELSWQWFSDAWFRIVRRVVLGDRAREDEELSSLLYTLRRRANWAFLLPKAGVRRQRFHQRLEDYLADPAPGSLASLVPRDTRMEPTAQIAQWLFAFDPAGMTTFRTLALLACHSSFQSRAREEALCRDTSTDGMFQSFTRCCVLEAVRLWPTTPAILREIAADMSCAGSLVAKGTGVMIYVPFFNRDDERLEFAHRMSPDIWEGAKCDALPKLGIVPFSHGPAICPAHNLVPLLASFAIDSILTRTNLSLVSPQLDLRNLPGTLNHFNIRLGASVCAA